MMMDQLRARYRPHVSTRSGNRDLGTLGSFVRPYRVELASAAALTVIASMLDLASPWPLKIIVDNAIGGLQLPQWLAPLRGLSPASLTAVAILTGIGLVAASGVIGYIVTYRMGRATELMGADLRSAAFGHLQRLSLRFHDRNRTGDLVSRLTSDVSRVQDSLVAWFQTVIPETLTLVGMFAIMLAVDPALALAALTVVPLLIAYVALSRPRIKGAQREARRQAGVVASRATEVLRHVRAVQAFTREDEEEQRFQVDSDAAARSSIGALVVSARLSPVADVILAVGAGFVLWLGVLGVRGGRITLGALLVVLTYLSSLYSPIRSLSRLSSTLAKGAASRERLTEIFEAPELVAEDPMPHAAPTGPSSIVLRGVGFEYRPGDPVLKDVSLNVGAGETLCVVGQTGAGKSTLLALLLRFYDPGQGRIEVGGLDIRSLSLRSLRERTALVPQDPWILDGSIGENIAFGRAGVTEADMRAAGRLALVDEFAERLPDGYDTPVGESGAQLSGGQRRRIALARALVRGASILLLDEPTSGLDATSEATVMEALRQASVGRTVVLVTHRLRISEIANRVLVLERGRVAEEGSRDDLLASGGAFARLMASQDYRGGPSSQPPLLLPRTRDFGRDNGTSDTEGGDSDGDQGRRKDLQQLRPSSEDEHQEAVQQQEQPLHGLTG